MKSSAVQKIRVLSFGILALGFVLVSKLYLVQLVHSDVYEEQAERQYVRPAGSIFNRGTIYFETKDNVLVPAAALKTGFTIALNPKLVVEPENTYEKLSAIISVDRDFFAEKVGKKDDPYEEIIRRVPEEAAL
ncbi:MAG: hypothetical protein Q7S15_00745, partial [bacterium]|nr:hypothetical protein [bacterium]